MVKLLHCKFIHTINYFKSKRSSQQNILADMAKHCFHSSWIKSCFLNTPSKEHHGWIIVILYLCVMANKCRNWITLTLNWLGSHTSTYYMCKLIDWIARYTTNFFSFMVFYSRWVICSCRITKQHLDSLTLCLEFSKLVFLYFFLIMSLLSLRFFEQGSYGPSYCRCICCIHYLENIHILNFFKLPLMSNYCSKKWVSD